MNILLNGICGYMGREVKKLCDANYRGAKLAFGVDPCGNGDVYTSFGSIPSVDGVDCIIDFSHHSATPALLDFATECKLPLVLCTTGHTDEEILLIHKASCEIPVFYSGNMSLGIALLIELAKTTASAFPEADIEIIEKHHNRKVDAPSGTALMIANAIKEVRPELEANCGRNGHGKRNNSEIGIHAIRMGNIVGEHEVIIGTLSQTITLKHEAHDRALVAEGAVAAAGFIVGQEAGLYDMTSLISGDRIGDTVISAE